MARQLSFDLPVTPDYTASGFVAAPSNAVACALIRDWPQWPQGKLVLSGPSGSGKTHLAHIWATDVDAEITQAL